MDIEGLDKILRKKSEKEMMDSPKEWMRTLETDFLMQAGRLERLAKANYTNAAMSYTINIADVEPVPGNPGTISAQVLKMRHDVPDGHVFRVEYFFTPERENPDKIGSALSIERFTDIKGDSRVFYDIDDEPVHISLGMITRAEELIIPQLETMANTAEMLETALYTERDNEVVRESFEELGRLAV